ncbi:MAG: aldehyde dehydrogenase family protein [Deltaproteobacteria bacterium]|nr:MAG: aldehyde dehydrogenase family protein [Deltaproteobacteria bacterium]
MLRSFPTGGPVPDLPLFRHYIDGSFQPSRSGQRAPVRAPATGETYAEVALGGASEVDAAARAAKAALRGAWGSMSPDQRWDLLERVADGIEARFDDFARAESRDTGKPLSLARAVDVPRAPANFQNYARLARSVGGDAWEQHLAGGGRALHYTRHRPVGVVGVIVPWNLPLLLLTWKVAPALAMGNTVVAKPSEETPATATLLAEVFDRVGVPPGVFNVVHGAAQAGEALVSHAEVAAITFTGSTATGQRIQAASAPGLRKLSFELGGKNPSLVFADADFDAALEGTVRSVFTNCGQVCLCSERVYVEAPMYDRFVEALVARAKALRPGLPDDPTTQLGPLISEEHRRKVLGAYERARAEGAQVLCGGGAPRLAGPAAGGTFVEPTVLAGLSDASDTNQHEIFGPVCHVAPFSTEAEALQRANETRYGLCAAIWTRDLSRAHRVAAGIEAGIVWVNTWNLRELRAPFGGVKLSGSGREGGLWSLKFGTETQAVSIRL